MLLNTVQAPFCAGPVTAGALQLSLLTGWEPSHVTSQTCSNCPARSASASAPVEQETAQQRQHASALTPKTLAATQAEAIQPICDGSRAAAEVGCPVH